MRKIQKGSTNRSVDVYIIDSTTGVPETGVLFDTAGMDLKYRRQLSAVVSVTEVTLAALTTVHTDGGFLEIGNGVYRFDLPDAAWATGADKVVIFGTVTGMIVLPQTVQLVNYDPEDVVRLGLTALPNAAAEAAGGLYTRGSGAGQINQQANGQLDVNVERLLNVAQSLLDLKDFADAGYNPATNKVQGVLLVDTTTTNSDMRGTDGVDTATMRGTDSASTHGDPDPGGLIATNLDAAVSTRATPAQVLTTALTEAYAADGAAGTLSQILYLILALLTESNVSGTTLTTKKLDGSTTAATFTLDDGTNPTSITRAT